MLEYFRQFVEIIVGNGTFLYFENSFVVELCAVILLCLTFFFIVKWILSVFRFFGNIFN